MATLAQRTQTLEQRTDRLESILASFMERTDSSIERLERAIERMEQEGARDREESARFRAEMARDREEMKRQADRERREFDALYVGARAVLLNETKSSPRMSDAQAFARVSGERRVRALLPAVSGAADRGGVLVAEHPGRHGHLADAARHLRHRDGRRGEAGALPGRRARPATKLDAARSIA